MSSTSPNIVPMAKPTWLQMPPRYILASLLTAMGDFLLGVDTSIIGPVTVMPSYIDYFGSHSAIVHGIIVSSILLSASFMSFIAGRPADVMGRPLAIALGAAILGAGAALEAGAVRLAMFMVGRIVEGMGFGLYFGTLTVYVCEIAPPSVRGPLTTGPQFMICLGLVAGYFTCYGTAKIEGSMSWRLPFIILVCLAAAFVTSVLLYLPPSPRWLQLHGRGEEAHAAWEALGVKVEDRPGIEEVLEGVANSGDGSPSSLSPTRAVIEQPKTEGSLFDLFKRDVRGRTMLAIFLMGFLQLSGIDAVLYATGLSSTEASFFASGISGIVLVVVLVPALLFADKWGRRSSTIIGGIGLTTTILLIGPLYASNAVNPSHGAARWIVIVCIYFYAVFFASTWAVNIKVFAPEIQPQHTRAKATALAHGFNWVCNWFVAFICPILLEKTRFGAYFLFDGCCALTTVVCFLFMVEARGKSLDEIERAFMRSVVDEEESKGLFWYLRKVKAMKVQ
ncbi:general substrate transporter [Aspergillus sclerotioniger CBS 115572]|uniref:General substrate transporter n=1 Tax=Aspergillus sclerotioniger CBS 115572 TaxID=1450535 RepID=A0A317X4P1_9EURO|nr:general substrate transporter [Aspergillus sclerotioniger CBS 115572]PWY93543.1 general substrate transporter [Aspergillus sclerotioniger CBS 115572]